MNILAGIAGLLTVVAFFAHTVVGGMEFRFVKPIDESAKAQQVKVQALCGWHMVSVDLGAAAIVLVLVAFTDLIPHEDIILIVLAGYFTLWGTAFLLSILVAGRAIEHALWKLPQWIYCYLVAGLAIFGAQ